MVVVATPLFFCLPFPRQGCNNQIALLLYQRFPEMPRDIFVYNVFEPGSTRRGDVAQAVLRLFVVAAIVVVYGVLLGGVGRYMEVRAPQFGMWPLYVALAMSGISVLMTVFTLLVAMRGRYRWRSVLRIVMPVLDVASLTALMLAGGEAMLPLFAVMILLMVGTGLRFGRRSLSITLCAVIASIVVLSLWPQHSGVGPMVAILMLLLAVIMDAYMYLILRMIAHGHLAQRAALKERLQYLAMISDTLLPPLERIAATSDALQATSSSTYDAEHTSRIKEDATTLAVMVKEMSQGLLGDSRTGSGSNEIHVRGVFATMMKMVASDAEQKDVRVTYTVDDDVPWIVQGDLFGFNRAVMNLLLTAVLRSPPGGVVDVRVRKGPRQSSDDLRIEVRFRTDRETAMRRRRDRQEEEQYRLIGRSMVSHLGGSIKRKAIGRDELLCVVTIPFRPAASGLGGAEVAGPASGLAEAGLTGAVEQMASAADMKILSVEDQKSNRILLQSILGRAGMQPRMCSNVERAIRHLETDSFDLVILDIHLQNSSGFDLVEHIRSAPGPDGRLTPIIFLTADQSPGVLERIKAIPEARVLIKPIVATDLLDAIRELTSGHSE